MLRGHNLIILHHHQIGERGLTLWEMALTINMCLRGRIRGNKTRVEKTITVATSPGQMNTEALTDAHYWRLTFACSRRANGNPSYKSRIKGRRQPSMFTLESFSKPSIMGGIFSTPLRGRTQWVNSSLLWLVVRFSGHLIRNKRRIKTALKKDETMLGIQRRDFNGSGRKPRRCLMWTGRLINRCTLENNNCLEYPDYI